MLSQLIVSNFTIAKQLEIEFSGGMTVVTGETGAGKSIMLDALGLALGDRSEGGTIGLHSDKAEIHAVFDLEGNQEAKKWLADHDLNNQECILRRVLSKDGRSRAYINGNPSTLHDMKALGEMLVDIHSQHEHQSLLKKETHRRLLDEFAKCTSQAEKVRELCLNYQKQQQLLEALRASNSDQTARFQLLSYQAEELKQLDIQKDETRQLEVEQKKLASAESILQSCQQTLDICTSTSDTGLLEQLSKSSKLLEAVKITEISSIAELFSSGKIQIEEAILDLQRFSSDFDLDPARLTEIEDRLSTIYELCRKHKIETDEIPALSEGIEQELSSLNNIDGDIIALEKEVAQLRTLYFTEAQKLSSTRTKAAKKLQTKVSAQIKLLGMSGATFEISLKKRDSDTPMVLGMEEIEFLISTNAGQTAKALNKIASGGELSRISLAIQVVTADTSRVPSLIFDEVDVGIGGGVAEVVGALLRKLGTKAQIICVTHLAQVAAQGHQHFKVSKDHKIKNQTSTTVASLSSEDKIDEIARMLGGIEMTDQSIAHAKEMYLTAQT